MLQNKYFKILKEFLNGYFVELYASDFFDRVNLSQKSISLILIDLENEGILKCSSSGNRKYYSLNFNNSLIKDYLALTEKFSRILFLEKNQKLIDFSNEVSGKIVCVFGSYARGNPDLNSDLDLLVVGNSDILEIQNLGKKYGLDVQVFNFSLSDFRKGVEKNLVLKECFSNHVVLSGENLFVEEVLKWKR